MQLNDSRQQICCALHNISFYSNVLGHKITEQGRGKVFYVGGAVGGGVWGVVNFCI